jgi:PAS domain S-box-containing protein
MPPYIAGYHEERSKMDTMIKILHLEDDPDDAELVRANLAEAGLVCRITIAQTRDEFETALHAGEMEIILADYRMPMYDGMSAFRRALEVCPDLPFIFVSGALGEEAAIDALTKGATDYVLKQNLSRLAPAVERALQEAMNRNERKKAEQQVTLMSFALNSIHEAAFMIDEKARIQYVNDEACRLLGYTRNELFTMDPQDINPLLSPQCLAGYWNDLKTRGALTYEGDIKTKDGRLLPVEINANYLEYLGKSYNLDLVRDITERKQAEQSIRKLSQAVEQSPVSIVITNIEGKIEFVNAKFTQTTGYSFADVLGRTHSVLQSEETSVGEYHRLWETISSGGIWQGEIKNRKKNGELFWERATISPIRDQDNAITHYVAVKEDITERKRLDEQLRQVQKMEAIGQLAGGIAHDFNNILSAITGYTELSISTLKPKSTAANYLAKVMEASKRAKDLVNQILMFSRKAAQELMPIRLDFPVKEALKLIRASIPATIEIRSKIRSTASALADPTQIHQIVMNLCTNGAQAMKESGGLLEVYLTDISIDHGDHQRKRYPDAKPGAYIRIAVSDQGCGIEAQYLHRIFDPFFTTKKLGEGTGMGLSVVHGIVRSYGGHIYAYSQLGKGSRFEILIPAQESDAVPETASEMTIPTGSESILFVDDEMMIVDIAKQMLESFGYHVIAKTNAVEALEAFKKDPDGFDLVVTDMTMPKMTGLDLAERIFQLRPGFPIVLCTGFDVSLSEEKILSHGLKAVIYKPILRQHMATVVRKALDHRLEACQHPDLTPGESRRAPDSG